MRPTARHAVKILVPLACLAGVIWVVVSIEPRKVAEAASGVDPAWFALSLVPLLGRFLTWALKWRWMVPGGGAMPFGIYLRSIFAGAFINLVTPTAKVAGGVYRSLVLHRLTGRRFSSAFGWTFADQCSNMTGCLVLFGLLSSGTVPGACVLLAVTAALLLRPWAWRKIERLESPGGRWAAWFPKSPDRSPREEPREGWLQSSLRPLLHDAAGWKATLRDVGMSIFSWSLLCLSNAMVFRSLGADAPLAEVAGALVLGAFAGSLSGLGGIGVAEVVLIGLYTRLGIDTPMAAAAAQFHRAAL